MRFVRNRLPRRYVRENIGMEFLCIHFFQANITSRAYYAPSVRYIFDMRILDTLNVRCNCRFRNLIKFKRAISRHFYRSLNQSPIAIRLTRSTLVASYAPRDIHIKVMNIKFIIKGKAFGVKLRRIH
jgi:hypothetical protein